SAGGHALLEYLELPAADRGKHVTESVVVADLRVLVVRRRIAGLGRQLARMRRQRTVRGDQHAAASGGDDLVAVERVDACSTKSARRATLVRSAERLGRILDEGYLV